MSPDPSATLPERLQRLRQELDAAARRSGRSLQALTLVAVTKSAPDGVFDLLADAGLRDVGESRVQAGQRRRAGRETSFRWHLVGHLQSNKLRAALGSFDVLHGLDSLELLERLDRVARELGLRPEAFLQVNVSGEPSKSGFSPAQLPGALERARGLAGLRLAGLMTIAPAAEDPQAARPVFAGLRELRDRLAPDLPQLSMGMSDDFTVAVEEGATCLRIGRRLVEDLPELRRPASPG
jgi:pyridoxal phosphate enzyme (YggS family)